MSWLTHALPGSGGVLHAAPNDFEVEEISAYDPSGEGEHALLLIEKVGLTTPEAIRRVARAFGVRDELVGRAGMKDKHAKTRQWLSIPAPIKVELPDPASLDLGGEDLRVLELERHGNKLKRGHLRGNRFTITVREVPEGGLDLLTCPDTGLGAPDRLVPFVIAGVGDEDEVQSPCRCRCRFIRAFARRDTEGGDKGEREQGEDRSHGCFGGGSSRRRKSIKLFSFFFSSAPAARVQPSQDVCPGEEFRK